MPKMTAKYKIAMQTAVSIGLAIPQSSIGLYDQLHRQGYAWDRDNEKWINLNNEPADPPTRLLMVRVWAANDVVQAAANRIVEMLVADGLVLESKSQPFQCRPPKQLESRIYLTFSPRGNQEIGMAWGDGDNAGN